MCKGSFAAGFGNVVAGGCVLILLSLRLTSPPPPWCGPVRFCRFSQLLPMLHCWLWRVFPCHHHQPWPGRCPAASQRKLATLEPSGSHWPASRSSRGPATSSLLPPSCPGLTCPCAQTSLLSLLTWCTPAASQQAAEKNVCIPDTPKGSRGLP